MSGKLDQSLDEILSTQRKGAGKGRRTTRRPAARLTSSAPIGGIKKTARPARGAAAKPAGGKASGAVGESKILVSNLPKDVSEAQIKEYFGQAVGQVKRVDLSYGPGGVSRGTANVTFHHADGASKAFSNLNGLLIDGKPVKVEVIVAKAELIPQPKTLSQRISNQPKSQPKSAAIVKNGANGAKGAAARKGGANPRARRAGRSARPAKKSQAELDTEMADYFNANSGTTEAGATAGATAAPGDAQMDDEVE